MAARADRSGPLQVANHSSSGEYDGALLIMTGLEKITYCLATLAAALLALYIAFWLDLDRPYWALFSVFIVSKPISGAVRAKGVYRFIGTLAGASMSVFLVPPLVQTPVLLCL